MLKPFCTKEARNLPNKQNQQGYEPTQKNSTKLLYQILHEMVCTDPIPQLPQKTYNPKNKANNSPAIRNDLYCHNAFTMFSKFISSLTKIYWFENDFRKGP